MRSNRPVVPTLAAILALASTGASALAHGSTLKDMTKGHIEAPLEKTIAPFSSTPSATRYGTSAPNVTLRSPTSLKDVGKGAIESPLKSIMMPDPTVVAQPRKVASRSQFVNPKVAPGLVQWHKTLQEACQASAVSHKPVLLFQMMGNLDDRFC